MLEGGRLWTIRVDPGFYQAHNYIKTKGAFASLNFWKKLPDNFGMTNSISVNIINSNILHLKASKMHHINTKISKNFGIGDWGHSPLPKPHPLWGKNKPTFNFASLFFKSWLRASFPWSSPGNPATEGGRKMVEFVWVWLYFRYIIVCCYHYSKQRTWNKTMGFSSHIEGLLLQVGNKIVLFFIIPWLLLLTMLELIFLNKTPP